MLPFLHDRLRRLGLLLEHSSGVLTKYNRLDTDTPVALTGLMDDIIAGYHALDRATTENEMLALKAECVAASHGTNPLTLELVTSNRRTMQRAIALRVLQTSAARLRNDMEHDAETLANATAQLRPLLLVGIQKGLVPLPWDPQHGGIAIEQVWRALRGEADLRMATRQLSMQVSVPDIHLLLLPLVEMATA